MISQIWQLLFVQGWAVSILKGSGVTLLLGIVGMLLGLLIALPMAVIRWRRVAILSHIVAAYTTVVRSIPGLLIIYLLFFGSVETVDRIGAIFGFQAAVQHAYGFIMGVVSISVISSAYSVEVLRGALQSIPIGMIEAAKALAFSRRHVYLRIIAPLMFRHALAGINNVWQMTIKDTSLVSVVGLQELMRVSAIAAGISHSPLMFYVIAGMVFLLITGCSQKLFDLSEHVLNRGFNWGR